MIELLYIGIPVVRTDGRSLARSVYGPMITKFSRMGRLPHFVSYGAPPTRSPSRPAYVELRYKHIFALSVNMVRRDLPIGKYCFLLI